jgi:hypothetical protein
MVKVYTRLAKIRINMENHNSFLSVIEPFDTEDLLISKRENLKMLLSKKSYKNKESLVSYLSGGQIILLVPAAESDCLSDDGEIIGSWSIYSDGRWLWRDFLIGYVKKYNIGLPKDFIVNAEHNNWVCPKLSVDAEEAVIEYLGNFGFFDDGDEKY